MSDSIYAEASNLTMSPNGDCCPDGLIINICDFEHIADVAKHCDIERLTPFIREAQDLHISNKIGWGLLDDIIAFPFNDCFTELMCGSTFNSCGKIQKHFGLKRVLTHYAYGLYKYAGSYVDTSYGTVYKNVQDSVPVDEKILKRLRDEHFNLANEYWKGVEKYLCVNKENYPDFDACNCACECGKCENKTSTGKSRLRKIKTFKKYGNNNNNKQLNGHIHNVCGCSNV